MGYKDPNAPASERQLQWVHGLWKTAQDRGLTTAVTYRVKAKHPRWFLGNDPAVFNQLDHMLCHGKGDATMEMAGEYIAACLEEMPDKKPKQRPRVAQRPGQNQPEPVELPPAANDPVPSTADTVNEMTATLDAYLVVSIPLTKGVTNEQAHAVSQLIAMFLRNKTSLPLSVGALEVVYTEGDPKGGN